MRQGSMQRVLAATSVGLFMAGRPCVVAAIDDPETSFSISSLNDVLLFAGAGVADYSEDVKIDPAKSDWDAPYFSFGGIWIYTDATEYMLRLRGMYWESEDAGETWSQDGDIVQQNDLQVSGFDVSAEFGYGFSGDKGRSVTPWVGLGFRREDFDRSRFRVTGDDGIGEDGSVEESYEIGLMSAALDVGIPLGKRWNLSATALFGFVFWNEANNALFGTVKGDGGSVIEASALVEYRVTPEQYVGIGVSYDFQEMDGDAVQSVIIVEGEVFQQVTEWPDNELERISVDAYWRVRI